MKISSHNGQGKVDDGDVEGFEEDGGTGQPEEDVLTGCEEGAFHYCKLDDDRSKV